MSAWKLAVVLVIGAPRVLAGPPPAEEPLRALGGTFGVVVFTNEKVVIAFDSAMVDEGTGRNCGETCKVGRVGDTFYALGGLGIIGGAGYDTTATVKRALRRAGSGFERQVLAVALALDADVGAVAELATDLPTVFLARVVDGVPHVARLATDRGGQDGIGVATEVFSANDVQSGVKALVFPAGTPGECAGNDAHFWQAHGEEAGAVLLVRRAIEDYPGLVAGPIDVACLDASGWYWLNRKTYCYEGRED